jgi:hypothetical protein
MSTEPRPPVPSRTLGAYIAELVRLLGEADPGARARLAEVIGVRRARITLDGETVEVAFAAGGGLEVGPAAPESRIDGEGATDRATTLDLLAARLEVSDAILDGFLEARGALEDVVRLFQAIEILLDAAPRIPALQALAAEYRQGLGRPAPAHGDPAPHSRRTPFPPDDLPDDEAAVLRRLGLLP